LLQGENVGLITRRNAQVVLDHGRAFGLDFEPFVRSNQLEAIAKPRMGPVKRFVFNGRNPVLQLLLVLLEYIPKVIENAARLKDDRQITREFDAFLAGETVQRLVLDPITPLLATPSSPAAVFRARSLIQTYGELQLTCLYIFDTPEGEDYLANCKDFVYGVLRFEAGALPGTQGRIVLERYPGLKGRPTQVQFEVIPGAGLTELVEAAPGTAGPGGQPPVSRKVLVIEPDANQRELLCSLLSKSYTVLQADGAGDGLAKVAAESPDLIIMEKDTKGLDGAEICNKLRQNKMNPPIMLLAEKIRRARDRVEIMAAGADECLERPFDGRLLKLKVHNLLRRYDSSKDRLASGTLDASVTSAFQRDKTTLTTNLTCFYDRLRQEIVHSTENALSFALLVLRQPDGSALPQEIGDLVRPLVREYDLIFASERRIGVLLAETDEKGVQVFLNRFQQRWNRTPTPTVEYRCFDRRVNFLEVAKQLLEGVEPPGQAAGRGELERV